MGKATIIEAQKSDTIYENGGSGILGKLKGIFADYRRGTRNSDRLYTEELWDNRVFGNEDVMEALETRTLFGELDHPEGDRCETLAKNAAISITKLEKKTDEGVIYGEADILNTPTGRIVKALADAGAKLGISSRGMGEEIMVEGQNIIDPETYDFITFDVVVTPANEKARVALTENKHVSKLTESIKNEISKSDTENQLNQIKTVVESIDIAGKTDLLNLVETKSVELNPVVVSAKLTEANKNLALKLVKEKYINTVKQLDEALVTTNELSNENMELVEKNEFLSNSRVLLKAKLKESNTAIKGLKTELEEKGSKIESIKSELEESKKLQESNSEKINTLSNKLVEESNKHRELILKSRQIANKKAENILKDCNEKITALQESIKIKEDEISKLTENNQEYKNKIEEFNNILVENKKLKQQLNEVKLNQESQHKKMVESKLQESQRIRVLEDKIKELEENNAKMEEANNRFEKLAFNPVGTVKAIAENFQYQNNYDEEDMELFNALTNNRG